MANVPPPSYDESQKTASAPLLENNPQPPQPGFGPPPVNNQYQQGQPPYPPPPQQPGYPPQQPGYPPQQQPSYQPQQPGYPPQQQGYPPPPAGKGYGQPPNYGSQQAGSTTTTIIASQPAPPIVTNVYFGESPITMTCFHCRSQIVTATRYEAGSFAWLIAGILFFFGCWLGCCCIPFCANSCQDAFHSCPNCKAQLGVYRRL